MRNNQAKSNEISLIRQQFGNNAILLESAIEKEKWTQE